MLTQDEMPMSNHQTAMSHMIHLLDTERLLDILHKQFPQSDLLGLEKHYIRYKPGTSMLVKYLLRWREGSLPLYAKLYSEAHSKIDNGNKKQMTPVIEGLGRLALPSVPLELYFFPNDARLRSVRKLFDQAKRKALFKELLPQAFQHAELETLHYKPERRYVARLTAADGRKAVLKAYRYDAYERSFANLCQLEAQGVDFFPRLLGNSDKHLMLAFAWQEGDILSEQWRDDHFAIGYLETLAAQLADFHLGTWMADDNSNTRKNDLREIVRGISHLAPHLQAQAASLATRLQYELQQIPAIKTRCHGDFYADQVLCNDGEILWLDLDDVCLAHPASDVANFIAHMEWAVIRGNLRAMQAAHYQRMFVNAYQQHATIRLDPRHLKVWIAARLFQLVHHPFRQCLDDWQAQMHAMLTRVNEVLSAMSPVAPHHAPMGKTLIANPYPTDEDASLKRFVAQAIHPEHCLRLFKKYLPTSITRGARLHFDSIRVVRHKPGKRCLIEYTFTCLEQQYTLYGKIRAKGLQRSIYRVNERLYQAAFGPLSAAQWQVPRPVCMIPELNMWLQNRVEGKEFSRLVGAENATELARQIARMSHALHRTYVPVAKLHSPNQELEILKKQLCHVAEQQPLWKADIHRLYHQLVELSRPLIKRPSTCIHRDFYPEQVMVKDEQLYLLDLDLFCMGDPCLDIGNFIAHLQEQALRDIADIDYFKPLESALTEAYLEQGCWQHDDRQAIEIYSLLSLARHIAISQRIPDRAYLGQALLSQSLQRAGAML